MGASASIPVSHDHMNLKILTEKLEQLEAETKDFKSCTGLDCQHNYIELWGDNLMCTDCRPAKKITEEEFPDKYRQEKATMQKLGDEDLSTPEESANRGVSIAFLVAFCKAFNLWDVPTRRVRRDFVIPMTSKHRCRFVELLMMVEADVVGPAVTFISHGWSGSFGDLVAAVSDGADYSRKVWVDIFSVRQWPCSKSDLAFEAVIERCPSFLIVCPSIPALRDVVDISSLPRDVQERIPFFRVWCLYEAFYAASFNRAMVLKAGSQKLIQEKQEHSFESDMKMMISLMYYIDIRGASATNPVDKDMIFQKITTFLGGVDGMNERVKHVTRSAFFSTDSPLLQCALCGDQGAKQEIRKHPSKYLQPIARGGYLTLLRDILDKRKDLINWRGGYGMTLLILAAQGDSLDCVQYLLGMGADPHAKDDGGATALFYARTNGFLHIVTCLQAK